MDRSDIKRSVGALYNAMRGLCLPATLIRISAGTYVPGSGHSDVETQSDARLLPTKTRTGRSAAASGPEIEPRTKIGLLESPDVEPRAGDGLMISDVRHVILQAASMDLETGILYEVWYQ